MRIASKTNTHRAKKNLDQKNRTKSFTSRHFKKKMITLHFYYLAIIKKFPVFSEHKQIISRR